MKIYSEKALDKRFGVNGHPRENVFTYSVQDDTAMDDIYNGTLAECKRFIKKHPDKHFESIALIEIDKDGMFEMCHGEEKN